MSPGVDPERVRNGTVASIASGRRRAVLRHLLGRGSPASEQELATHLAATDRRPSSAAAAPTEVQSIRTELRHNHLPRLADAGLVVWNRDAATVEAASHAALDDPRFRLLLAATVDGLDEALAHVADERRRLLLTVLREAALSLTETDLARELLRAGDGSLEPDAGALADVVASLRHRHLPALDDDGLVEYDPDAGRATYADHPALDEVFTVIHDPEPLLVDEYDTFLAGLGEASSALGREPGERAEWPQFWEGAHRG